jgi:hypothetical protein
MSDSITCATCGLGYLPQDGACPHCAASALAAARPQRARGPAERIPAELRFASLTVAVILLVNAAMTIVSLVVLHGQPRLNVASAVIDVILGVSILAGREAARRWTMYRAIFGAVIGTMMTFVLHDTATAIFQLLYAGALLLLLVGRPGRARTWCGLAIGSVLVLLEALGLALIAHR